MAINNPDPTDQAQLNALYSQYVQLLQQSKGIAAAQAISMADSAKNAGILKDTFESLKKELNDTVYLSDSLAKSFRETLAELKNQNVALQVGRSVFKDLTNVASDLSYFQRGIVDLEDRHFKKKQQSLDISRDNLENIKKQLEGVNGIYNKQSLLERLQNARDKDILTSSQKKYLLELEKEEDLLNAANNALEEGLGILQRELNISKQIYDVREDLGGLAGAAAATISQYGGDLARFLKIDDALEATRKYNQDAINNALTNKKVLNDIRNIDKERVKANQDLLDAQEQLANGNITAAQLIEKNKEITQQLASLDEKEYKIKQAAIESASRGLTGFINKFKSLGVLIQGLGTGLRKALTDPITIITFFIGRALEANKQAVEIGKSLGISANAASRLRENFIEYSNTVNDNFINQTRLVKAQNELSKAIGLSVKFREEELATFARLTELQGLSSEEGAKILRIASITGKTYKGYVNDVAKSAYYASVSTKQNITSREVLQTISKLSAGILVKFRGNTDALVGAVAEAKKLGLTLDQIDKVGESLLNWEQSIENELKAELLTGRQINLERARYAALTGDQLTLTREITSQVGTLAEYEGMNVLAQRSLAEAFGLSREEMSEMLIQQELINKYGDEAVKLTEKQREEFIAAQKARPNLTLGEYLNEQQQQLDIQTKFNNAVIKLQELIGGLVEGPLSRLIDHLTSGLNLVTKIFGAFGQIGSEIKGLFGNKIGGLLGDVASVASIGALIALVASSLTKGTPINPVFTVPLGGATGLFGKMGKFLGIGGKAATPAATTVAAANTVSTTAAAANTVNATNAANAAATTTAANAAKVVTPSPTTTPIATNTAKVVTPSPTTTSAITGGPQKPTQIYQTQATKIEDKFAKLNTKISNAFADLNTRISNAFTKAGAKISNSFTNAGTRISSFFSNAGTNISNIFTKATTGISNAFVNAGVRISSFFSNAGASISGAFTKLIAKLSTAFTPLVAQIKNIGSTSSAVFKGIGSTVSTVFKGIGSTSSSIFGGMKSLISTTFKPLVNMFGSLFGKIGNGISFLAKEIGPLFGRIGNGVSSLTKGIGSTSSTVFKGIGSTLSTAFKPLTSLFGTLFGKIGSGLSSLVKGTGSLFGNIAKKLGGGGILTGVIGGALGYVKKKQEGATTGEAVGAGVVQGALGAAGFALGAAFGGPIGGMIGGFLGDALGGWINEKAPGVAKSVGKVWDSMVSKFSGAFNAIGKMFTQWGVWLDGLLKPFGGLEEVMGGLANILGTAIITPFTTLFSVLGFGADIIKGLAQILSGDFMDGLKTMYTGLGDLISNVFEPFMDLFKWLFGKSSEGKVEEPKKASVEKAAKTTVNPTPAVAAPVPATSPTPGLANGGEVLKTGIAKVDAGEVFLGKSTRGTFQLLASNSIAQTQYLKALIDVLPLNTLNLTPVVDAVNNLSTKITNLVKPSPSPIAAIPTPPSVNFDTKPFNDAVNKLLTTPLSINIQPLIEAIKGINMPSISVTSNVNVPKIDFTPLIDAIKGITFNPTITNQIDFTPLIDAINRINIAPTISNISPIINNQIDFAPVVDAIRKINIAPPQFNVSAEVEVPQITLPANEQPKTAIPQPVPQSPLPLISDTLKQITEASKPKAEQRPVAQQTNNVDIKSVVSAINALQNRPNVIKLYLDGKEMTVRLAQAVTSLQ